MCSGRGCGRSLAAVNVPMRRYVVLRRDLQEKQGWPLGNLAICSGLEHRCSPEHFMRTIRPDRVPQACAPARVPALRSTWP